MGSVNLARWSAISALAVAGCGDVEPTPEDVDIGVLSQAFSDEECQEASPDTILQIVGGTFNRTHASPVTYSNPDAFKSYVWEFQRTDAAATGAFPLLNVATTDAGFPATRYDTAAECTGLAIRQHIYYNASHVIESIDRGFWDDSIGCTLPHLEGPFLALPAYPSFTASRRIKVCATGRDANANTIPIRVRLLDFPPLPISFSSPRVKKGGTWPVRANSASGDAYCEKRGFERMLPCTGGSCPSLSGECTRGYVEWDDFIGDWRIPALPPTAPCQNVWTLLFCE